MLAAFTIFHVVLSLAGIGSGFVVLYGLLRAKQSGGWTKTFLTATVATSVTGFLFPFHGLTPGIGVGIISVIVLGAAMLALYRFDLAGAWRRTYVIASVTALYLNFFVLIVQSFEKIPPLRALAPTQSEPPFQATQLVALLLFVVLGTRAAMKFKAQPLRRAAGAG